ncbi:hypothetical protein MHBO_003066 [Bonamia ostreae]|uniref:Uncharacterized protein n=1 Tax=Bonamia ostreae TaxID=126728 RepID=A0ABV2APZ7_9EUKA
MHGFTFVTKDGYHIKLIRKPITSFEAMRRRERAIEVYPVKMLETLRRLENIKPKLKKYFEEKEKNERISEEHGGEQKRKQLEKQLEILQKRRLVVLTEIKRTVQSKKSKI